MNKFKGVIEKNDFRVVRYPDYCAFCIDETAALVLRVFVGAFDSVYSMHDIDIPYVGDCVR